MSARVAARSLSLLPSAPSRREIRAGLAHVFATPRAWLVAVAGALAYLAAYLLLGRSLVVSREAHFSRFVGIPSLVSAPDLSPRYIFDAFNPPAILYLGDGVALGPPVPIALAGLLLGALVGANLAVAVESLTYRASACARSGISALLGTLPSFLASFSCCAPTVLLVLGANFAVGVVAVVPFVVPAAAVLLVGSLLWSARRFERIVTGQFDAGGPVPGSSGS